jgi:hypothetical protein
MKVSGEGKSNQEGDDEPTAVQSNRYSCNSAQFDLCMHGEGLPRNIGARSHEGRYIAAPAQKWSKK